MDAILAHGDHILSIPVFFISLFLSNYCLCFLLLTLVHLHQEALEHYLVLVQFDTEGL